MHILHDAAQTLEWKHPVCGMVRTWQGAIVGQSKFVLPSMDMALLGLLLSRRYLYDTSSSSLRPVPRFSCDIVFRTLLAAYLHLQQC